MSQNIQSQIEEAKKKRDELNKKTKDYINSLQDIELKIEETLNLAKNKHKKKRDNWNKKVAQLKDKKIEYKDLLNDLIAEKRSIQRKRNNNKGNLVSVKQIERKIENLERMIETENLELSEENAIVDKIRDLAEQKQNLVSEEKNNEFFRKEKQIEIVKINLNKIYEQLNKWSNKSQDYHNKMLEAYDNANDLREQKRKLEEELIENKKKADKFHEKYLNLLKKRKGRSRGRGRRQYKKKPRYGGRDNKRLEKIKQDKLETALEKQKAGKKLNIYEARLILEKKEN
ncbi:MAG: hypothetical protein GF317_10550 [Candidatus Lokiarchaeota archaeon]|nr:hypothetical protein [Candidatus Lokiarchaeota archaeon]MBD3200100.1 hypothetical protein [Candidatus Lokiarchaeota archaeon]